MKTAFGTATSTQSFTVLPTLRLEGVLSVASDNDGFCARLTSSGVDCWGYGDLGGLGNGTGARAAVPVAVEGVGGSGTLSAVKSIAQDSSAFCALSTGGQVACWGSGQFGQLGNGGSTQSDFPVSVVGVGGTGTLSGVAKVVGSPSNNDEFCALLTSGRVDCWGEFDGFALDSAVPVAIKAVGGVGNLAGVTNLASDGGGFCARMKTGGVDCWGSSLTASVVVGVGGTGTLTGVTALAAEQGTYCAVTTSGGADCWGDGANGQLGNGIFYTSGAGGSAVPVVVEGVGGTGALSGVKNLIGNGEGYSFCALLTSGSVDCWGSGLYGQLGNGVFYTTGTEGSAVPVTVVGLSGTGTLSGVKALNNEGGYSFCAVLTTELADCWGFGADGELGNGNAYTTGTEGSAVPVAVGGKSQLNAVMAVFGGSTGIRSATSSSACALLPQGRLSCWGDGEAGQLGNEQFYLYPPFGSPKPVTVVAVGSG